MDRDHLNDGWPCLMERVDINSCLLVGASCDAIGYEVFGLRWILNSS